MLHIASGVWEVYDSTGDKMTSLPCWKALEALQSPNSWVEKQ